MSKPDSRVAFVICSESPIEGKSVLLARSIREFGGTLRSAPILSFSPRGPALRLSDWALAEFDRLKVAHSDAVLNSRYPDSGVNNKPFVCAHCEKSGAMDVLIFVDSDMVILNEPAALRLKPDEDATLRPVDCINIGVSQLQGGPNELYWSRLFELCGAPPPPLLKTTVDQREIFRYFNSGLISARTDRRIFERWREALVAVRENKLEPTHPFFIEQSIFSAVLAEPAYRVSILPSSYNYPVHLHQLVPSAERARRLDDLVTIHYHRLFDNGAGAPALRERGLRPEDGERSAWLYENLDELGPHITGRTRVAPAAP